MSGLGGILSLIGLLTDILGFILISRDLLKHPDQRPFWGGGNTEFRLGMLGFFLVIAGFLAQAIGQAMTLLR